MRAVADRVVIAAMADYRPEGDWRQRVIASCLRIWDAFAEHPQLATIWGRYASSGTGSRSCSSAWSPPEPRSTPCAPKSSSRVWNPSASPSSAPTPNASAIRSGWPGEVGRGSVGWAVNRIAGTGGGWLVGSEPWGVEDFPAALSGRVERVRLLAVGGEAVVFLVKPGSGWWGGVDEVVVKVEKTARVDSHKLRLLSLRDFGRHVPRIFEFGDTEMRGSTVGWVAQEYCAHGSLHDVVYGHAPPAGRAELRLIVAELAECLNFWVGEQGLTHTDVKPANILVRSRDPYELLIGDFGGSARGVRSGALDRRVSLTLSYASPESLRGARGPQAAWWALGIIAYELLLHRTPYGAMPPSEVRKMLHARRRPALDGVADPDWRRLVEGLLDVEPQRRWGYEQVAAWAAGGRRPPRFNGTAYRRIEHLVDDLDQNWQLGAGWLAANGSLVADWLVELGSGADEVGYLRGLSPGRAAQALGELTARVLPEVTPRYRGRPISVAGLLDLARRGDAEQRLLRRALEDGALEYAAGHRCAHPGCRGRCAVLDRVGAEVPEIVGRAEVKLGWLREQVIRSYRGRPPAELPSEREWTMVWAWATEMTLRPEAALRVRDLVAGVPSGAPWWPGRRRAAETADPATVEGRADLVVTQLLAGHARRATGQ